MADLFTGTWKFNPALLKLSTASPQSWIQRIEVNGESVQVTEEITDPAGARSLVQVQARFDGLDYEASGRPLQTRLRTRA